MRIATAEIPDEVAGYAATIDKIAAHVEDERPDLLVLPEMPFAPWIFHSAVFDATSWAQIVAQHAEWLDRLAHRVSVPILASRPTTQNGARLNQAFYVDGERRCFHVGWTRHRRTAL